MAVAYLVNQYPQPSQTFIRREIAALEASGITIARWTVRRYDGLLPDPADEAERRLTSVILDGGAIRLLLATLRVAVATPRRFLSALRLTWTCGGRANRRLVHLVYLAEACRLKPLLRNEGVRHLHAHFGTNSASVAMLCREIGGPPYSFTTHGPEEFDAPEALSLGEKVARSAFAVAVSQFGRSQLLRWSRPEDWAKVTVVHCGVDATFLGLSSTPASVSPEHRTSFVCVGRLVGQKGQLVLLDACRHLVNEGIDFHLSLIGDGPMRPAVERRIAEHGLGDRVTLLGWCSNAAVRRVMRASRFVVQPSFAEGLPVAIMEALSLRRPVVTTWVAGTPELVRDHGEDCCGWLVPAGSVEALGEALRSALATDDATWSAMGEAGARRVRGRHDVRAEVSLLAARMVAA